MTRHGDWYHKRFAGDVSGVALFEGEKLLGELLDHCRQSGLQHGARHAVFSDGSRGKALFAGGQPILQIVPPPPPEPQPQIVLARPGVAVEIKVYISSTGGLRIFDYVTGDMQTVTGLHDYEVDAVSQQGDVVHMAGSGAVVRVDLAAEPPSAFARTNYPTTALGSEDTASAYPLVVRMNAAEDRLLGVFRLVYRVSDSVALDGLGGALLIDPTTLAPLRSTIRMGFRPWANCWAPNGEAFYLATTVAADLNGTPPESPNVAESPSEYVSMFDKNGVLLGSRLVYTWTNTPNSGFARLIGAMAVNHAGSRLYAFRVHELAVEAAGITLYVLDTTHVSMPIVATLELTADASDDVTSVQVARGDAYLQARINDGRFVRISVADDELTVLEDFSSALATTDAGAIDAPHTEYFDLLQQGPQTTRFGTLEDDDSWYVLTRDGASDAVLYGYNTFNDEDEKTYEVDLSALGVHKRYAIAMTGLQGQL